MAVQIRIDQPGSGAPAGVTGQAREDLVTGFAVQLTAVGGPFLAYQWSFIDRAIDIDAGTQAASAMTTPNAAVTLGTPISLPGTYFVQVLVDSGNGLGAGPDDVARITFYAGTTLNALNTDPAELPRREMAFRERTEHNVPDAIFPAGNARGWAEERLRWQAALIRMYRGKSWAWAAVRMPGGGPAAVEAQENIAGVVYSAVGVYDVTFTRPMPNATYSVEVEAYNTPGQGYADTRTINGFRAYRADQFGLAVDGDFTINVRVQS